MSDNKFLVMHNRLKVVNFASFRTVLSGGCGAAWHGGLQGCYAACFVADLPV